MKRALYLLLSISVLSGCYNDDKETLYPSTNCNTSTVTYTSTVKPIITQYCGFSGCHAGAAPASGIDLSTHSGLQIIALNGKLKGVINHTAGFSPMPKNGGKLTDCQISQIEKWITDGALNN